MLIPALIEKIVFESDVGTADMALHCIHDVYVVMPSSIRRGIWDLARPQRPSAAAVEHQHILIVVDEREKAHYFERIERILNSAAGTVVDQSPAHRLRITGTLDETVSLVINQHIDTVIILLDRSPELYSLIRALSHLPVKVWLACSTSVIEPAATLGEYRLFNPFAYILAPHQRVIKRCIDVLLSLVLMITILPLMGFIACAIRIDTRGPVIFKQVRLGQHGRPFVMYKFRSMRIVDRHETQESYKKVPDDPRITPVGKVIRRMSLDELPQLFNVLKGDMSLVGPRPELPEVVRDHYESWQYMRFVVPQGMTGKWQVNGRSNRPMYLHTEDDLHYIQHYSLWMDIQILIQTLPAVIRQRGAY